MQSCAMVPELKSRGALENGDYSLKAARIGVPSCTGTGVCSCVLPQPASMHGHIASLSQVDPHVIPSLPSAPPRGLSCAVGVTISLRPGLPPDRGARWSAVEQARIKRFHYSFGGAGAPEAHVLAKWSELCAWAPDMPRDARRLVVQGLASVEDMQSNVRTARGCVLCGKTATDSGTWVGRWGGRAGLMGMDVLQGTGSPHLPIIS